MSFYNNVVLPRLCHLAMSNKRLAPYRRRVVSSAQGRVLEIGMGSGLNLPFYSNGVTSIHGLEPIPRLIAMTQRALGPSSTKPIVLIQGSAQTIPLDSRSIDTVVTTWTLCTIPDAAQALTEIRRVLKKGGQLLFVEHGLAPESRVQKWQNGLTPLWSRISGGCHLNRPIKDLMDKAGFVVTGVETGYMDGPKPLSFMYEGRAVPR